MEKNTNQKAKPWLNKLTISKVNLAVFPHTWVSWAWLTCGSRRGVELVDSSADPATDGPDVVPIDGGASPVVDDAPGATLGATVPVVVVAASSSGRTVPSLSFASRSWMTGSPLRIWQRMASMDSAILPPYTFSGFRFHRLRMQLNAAWMKGKSMLQITTLRQKKTKKTPRMMIC